MAGTVVPLRCLAAPSSVGAGILLQSTSSRFFWFIARPHCFAGGWSEAISIMNIRAADGFCCATHPTNGLPSRTQQPALLARPIAFFLALAFVVQLLALGDGQQQLGAAALIKVKLERDQRH